MEILQLNSETKQNILEHLLKRSPNHYAGYESRVADMLLCYYETRFLSI